MKYTEDLIKEFKENNKGRIITNLWKIWLAKQS